VYLEPDGMVLVNNFEDTFGNKYGEGVWTELSGTASSNIHENIVALASFNGELTSLYIVRWLLFHRKSYIVTTA
jgi:hypothetical protein